MITKEQADYLINLPKYIIEQIPKGQNIYLERKNYVPSIPIDDRIYLASKVDDEFTFFLEIYQSNKNQLKITLHFQEDDASIGLLRVDFNGRHKNPVIAEENLPSIFKKYTDAWIEESHIHYFFEGYKPLSWAIPLKEDSSFPIKDFTDTSQIGSIVQAFGKKINMLTILMLTFQKEIHELD
jgi:hypothetical protein